jgi:hypothetical protein
MRNHFNVSPASREQRDALPTRWRQLGTAWKRESWWLVVPASCVLAVAFFHWYAYSMAGAIPLVLGKALDLLKLLASDLTKEQRRLVVDVVVFLLGTGVSFIFLLPLRWLVHERLKSCFTAAFCVAPTVWFCISIRPHQQQGRLVEWSQVAEPLVGVLLYFILLAAVPPRPRLREHRRAEA